jgi:hypothetical protein
MSIGPVVVREISRKEVDLHLDGLNSNEESCKILSFKVDGVEKKPSTARNNYPTRRSQEELAEMHGNKDFCSCGKTFREKNWESSPGWWVHGAIKEGSTVFTLMRRGPNGRDEPYTRRYCPKCSIAVFDMLLTLGLNPQPHLNSRTAR